MVLKRWSFGGHKLHSHTHSYIHDSFYKAFKSLGYPTYWFDDKDDIKDFDFAGTLFLTEGQADKNIPLRDDCCYMIHNCASTKYQSLDPRKNIYFQVYTDSILSIPTLVKIDHCIYYDLPGRCVYMPWATDLLPEEIDEIKKGVTPNSSNDSIYWIGTIGDGIFGNIDQLSPFIKACKEKGIAFYHRTNVSPDLSIKLIQDSYLAPAIVGKWQRENGYIPCRIFKNISYGKLGLTNSLRVFELFEGKIVYHPDTYQLFYDAQKRLETLTFEELFDLMDFVKNKHTYLNRIDVMLNFLELVLQQN